MTADQSLKAQQSPSAERADAPRTGGQILVDSLLAHGVDRAFCVPGESYLAVLDALYDVRERIDLIVCRHEAGAANMAEAVGKLTGKPGICFVTRGPGACHASVGVHTAKQDSTPMILFVGQVPRDQKGREAFQEVDYRATFGDLAKWATEVEDPARLSEIVARAFQVATSGRPGPVVIALPEDMLREEARIGPPSASTAAAAQPGPDAMADLLQILAGADRPLLLMGGPGWRPQGLQNVAEFAKGWGLPVACGFRRQDLFDNRDPHYAGDVGLGINPALQARIARADVILAVGTRLGEIVTGGYEHLSVPYPAQTLVHVHADRGELGKVYQPALGINADPNAFAAAAVALDGGDPDRWKNWRDGARADYEAWQQPVDVAGPVDMGAICRWLSDTLPEDAIIANDAGNFSIWLHRFFRYKQPGTQLAPTSGAMGYGVPAAIAARLTHPGRTVVSWVGDGCFLMTGQELATAAMYDARVIFVVVNNGMYGTIRMHQEKTYPDRVIATDLANPDFVALAEAYGVAGFRVEATEEFAPAFEAAGQANRPALIEIRLPHEELSPSMKLKP